MCCALILSIMSTICNAPTQTNVRCSTTLHIKLQCIALNPNWSKAHIRLASAYIAQGDHSNDACQALQRALSLDPSNKVARQMLVNELRRRGDGGGSSSMQSTKEVRKRGEQKIMLVLLHRQHHPFQSNLHLTPIITPIPTTT